MSLSVCVCIPCYNGEKYIAKTLDSLSNQGFRHFECVVMDNCSSDRTVEIAQNFIGRFENLKVITSDVTVSAEDNFNKCLFYAKTDLICVYHSDDVYEKDIIEDSVRFLENNHDCGAVSTLGKMIDSHDNVLAKKFKLPFELRRLNRCVYSFVEIFSAILNRGGNSFFVCPSVMIRKNVVEEIGGFEYKKFGSSSDVALWLKISDKFGMGILQKDLISYRVHMEQGSQFLVRDCISMPDLMHVAKYFRGRLENEGLSKNYNAFVANQVAKLAFKRIRRSRFTHIRSLFKISFNYLLKSVPTLNKKTFETIANLAIVGISLVFRSIFKLKSNSI